MKLNVKKSCKIGDIVVEYSDPEIQPYEGFLTVDNYNQVMYFYYTLTVSRITNGDMMTGRESQKKELFSIQTIDFPALPELLKYIQEIEKDMDFLTLLKESAKEPGIFMPLNTDASQEKLGIASRMPDWQYTFRELKGRKQEIYQKTYETGSHWLNEDYYNVLVEAVNTDNGGVRDFLQSYSLTIGYCNEFEGMSSIDSVTLSHISEAEFCEFKNTIKEFMNETLKAYNKKVDKNLESTPKRLEICEGKLRIYENEKHSKIETLLAEEDNAELYIKELIDGKPYEVCYKACTIKGFDKNTNEVLFTCGYKKGIEPKIKQFKKDEIIKIKVEDLLYVFHDLTPRGDILSYGFDKCKDEFYNVLSETEKEEFNTKKKKELYKKWGQAIADRTWMYREEHGFKDTKKAIKKIVKNIKCE